MYMHVFSQTCHSAIMLPYLLAEQGKDINKQPF